MHRRAVGVSALEIGLVVAWCSGFIGARLAADTSSVFLVLFWRFALVSLALLPVVVFFAMRGLSPRDIAIEAVVGALAMFGYLALGVKSVDLGVSLGTAALISALQPLVAAALAGPILGDLVRRRQWAGLLVGLSGVVVAVWGSLGLGAPAIGYGLSFGGMLSLVLATILAKARPTSLPVIAALGIQTITTAILFLPLAVLDGGISPPADRQFILSVAWFIVFSTIVAYSLYWICLRRSTVTRVGALIYLTPPVTAVWAWLMFGEPLTLSIGIAFVLCAVGVLITGEGRAVDRTR